MKHLWAGVLMWGMTCLLIVGGDPAVAASPEQTTTKGRVYRAAPRSQGTVRYNRPVSRSNQVQRWNSSARAAGNMGRAAKVGRTVNQANRQGRVSVPPRANAYDGTVLQGGRHAPEGYIAAGGLNQPKIQHVITPAKPYQPPRANQPFTGTPGWSGGGSGGWGMPPPPNPAEGRSNVPFTTNSPGGRRSTAGEDMNYGLHYRPPSSNQGVKPSGGGWGGAPPPNPAQGRSGVPYNRPTGNTSTSGEVR